jgi:hypothetical protein
MNTDERRWKTRIFRRASAVILAFILPALAWGQGPAEYQQILERLDRLEKQNRELLEQVATLRKELAATRAAPEADEGSTAAAVARLEEKVAVQQQQMQDQAHTRVESAQHFPIRITGMALFNSYLNGRYNGTNQYPSVASATPGTDRGSATLRQTVIGLEFRGPEVWGGGKVRGSVYMDLFGGSGQSLDQLLRLRTGSIDIDWRSTSFSVGLEKPIFNPREPNSLAQVGVSPLTSAGNLWLWIPQARLEQRFRLGDQTQLRAQVGVVGTRESLGIQSVTNPPLDPSRPGLEGRFIFSHGAAEGRHIEIGPGFHYSSTHVANTSVPSSLISADWSIVPLTRVEVSGVFYSGQNVLNLGTGAIRQGFIVQSDGLVRPVHSQGGWAQVTLQATPRLSFNLFEGIEDDQNSDLLPGRIGRNSRYGANFFYRLAPNVIASFEYSQTRTSYLAVGNRLNNHYDFSLAYLF